MKNENETVENPQRRTAGLAGTTRTLAGEGNFSYDGTMVNDSGAHEAVDLLLPHHHAMLKASAISSKVMQERGYYSATKKSQLKKIGFTDSQCCVPTLVLPVRDVNGNIAFYQIRPDNPRTGKDGKLVKYDMPRLVKMALDVPPAARLHLGKRDRPLFITEGSKKADSAISHGLCCISLLGVWGWRGTNEDEGKTVLAAWESIALEDREVYIVFDSDIALKPEVYKALVRLKGFLELRKALVRVIYLEPKADGSKVGLDDFFVAEGVVATLLARATTTLRKGPTEEYAFPYRETPLGLIWLKPTREGPVEVPLSNFTARIATECEEDDGVETRRTFDVTVRQGERVATVRIPWEKFDAVNWPIEALGADGMIVPGPMVREHIRFAVQLFSQGAPKRKLYTHLGWRKVGEQWTYLHAGGAIGEAGSVPGIEVLTPTNLEQFLLPDPPQGEVLKAAIRASLGVLTVAPHIITFPLLAAIYRAVLGDTDFSVHVAGPTSMGKSELAALAQQHHGAGLDARHLPASWISSGNFLEGLAFTAKDSLLVIDDFAPTGNLADVQRMHRDADRVLRAQGNHAGRGRMRADATLRPAKPPRGLVLSTGEEIPRGQSLRARMLILEPAPGDVEWRILSGCQHDAAAGFYAQAMAGFLQWVAPQYEPINKRLREELADLRSEAVQGGHRRTPEIAANLALGLRYFLLFAGQVEAISSTQQEELWQSGWDALCHAASAQGKHQEASEPARRFLELINAVLSSGKAHLANTSGGSPNDAEAWGWRREVGDVGWQPKGNRIGWIDGEDIYLQSDSAYASAQDLARAQGDAIPLTVHTLRRRLKEKGYLRTWDEARETITVRQTLEGKRQDVLHLRKSLFSEGLSSPTKPDIDPKPPENGAETGKMVG